MQLDSLRVLNLSKVESSSEIETELRRALSPRLGLMLETCQRILFVTTAAGFDQTQLPRSFVPELLEGKEAYRYLLRVATGLESRIQGETDIFGQFKQAWAASQDLETEIRAKLAPWIQRVLEDTKEIRTHFIKNAGGSSYGSLVRRLIQDAPAGETLLIGAGQLAKSVAPYLLDRGLCLYNRTAGSADALAKGLLSEGSPEVRLLRFREEELEAWTKVTAIVLCVPPDPENDGERLESLRENPIWSSVSVIHLGIDSRLDTKWREIPGFKSLTDVFQLEKSQNDIRCALLKKAALACEERAKLRALGGSLSIAHGWEDLAAFG